MRDKCVNLMFSVTRERRKDEKNGNVRGRQKVIIIIKRKRKKKKGEIGQGEARGGGHSFGTCSSGC